MNKGIFNNVSIHLDNFLFCMLSQGYSVFSFSVIAWIIVPIIIQAITAYIRGE